MLISLAAAVLYFAQAAPDAAQPPASQAAPTPVEAAAGSSGKTVAPVIVTPKPTPIPPPKIANNMVQCHQEVLLGSRFPKMVCATKAEAADRRAQDQEQLREWVRVKPLASN